MSQNFVLQPFALALFVRAIYHAVKLCVHLCVSHAMMFNAYKVACMSDDYVNNSAASHPPEPHSYISVWLNRIFITLILVVMPVAWYFGYVGEKGLNRVGIIMNFAAGFMITPELLGVDRLNAIESFVKDNLKGLQDNLYITHVVKFLDDIKPLWLFAMTILEIIGLYLVYIFWNPIFNEIRSSWPAMIIWITIMGSGIIFRMIFTNDSYELGAKDYSKVSTRRKWFDVFRYTPLVPIGIIVSSFIAPIVIVLQMILLIFFAFIIKPTEFILGKLQGDKRLRDILIYWGIIFFIVGNLVQFIASFD